MPYTIAGAQTSPPSMAALLREGLATDSELSALQSALGPTLALRLLISAAHQGCGCGSTVGPSLVALDPGEGALPSDQAQALRGLRRGAAVADRGWAVLQGGTVALTGLDVLIASSAEFASGDEAGPIVLTLADFAAGLTATAEDHAPDIWTLVVVREVLTREVPEGWRVVAIADNGIAVATGLDVVAASCVAS